jgi:chromosome segregation ATPase
MPEAVVAAGAFRFTDRERTMANDTRSEMKRPIPMILAAVAVVGWIAVVWLAVSRNNVEEDLDQQLQAAAEAREELQASYDALQEASGELEDVQAQVGTETASLEDISAQRTAAQAEADTELERLTQQVEAARRSFELELAQLTDVRDAARGKLRGVQSQLANVEDETSARRAEMNELRSQTLRLAEQRLEQQAALGKAEYRTEEQGQQDRHAGHVLGIQRLEHEHQRPGQQAGNGKHPGRQRHRLQGPRPRFQHDIADSPGKRPG